MVPISRLNTSKTQTPESGSYDNRNLKRLVEFLLYALFFIAFSVIDIADTFRCM